MSFLLKMIVILFLIRVESDEKDHEQVDASAELFIHQSYFLRLNLQVSTICKLGLENQIQSLIIN